MKLIIITHIFPPIPCRQFDWCAHYQGEEGAVMDVGWGATREEAAGDLMENFPRDELSGYIVDDGNVRAVQ